LSFDIFSKNWERHSCCKKSVLHYFFSIAFNQEWLRFVMTTWHHQVKREG
jgi:hypothetical protein